MNLSDFKPRSKESQRILQNESVLEVYQTFADGCMRCYNMDITKHPSPYFTAITLKQVRAFVLYYGKLDAVNIVNALFGVGHEGMWHGEIVGKDLFSQRKRWMADKLLIEAQRFEVVEREDDDANGAAELEAIKARIKPRFA